jgi:hypothetical protein
MGRRLFAQPGMPLTREVMTAARPWPVEAGCLRWPSPTRLPRRRPDRASHVCRCRPRRRGAARVLNECSGPDAVRESNPLGVPRLVDGVGPA